MDIAGFALRDIALVLAGLVGIYLVFMVLRLVQVARRKSAAFEDEPEDEAIAPVVGVEDDDDEAPVYSRPTAPDKAPAVSSFGAELQRSSNEQEVRQLRDEIAQLRQEVATLHAELNDIKAARNISPQYSDAMALAQRGLTAQDVADRCGISLGEAELVWALSRGANNLEQEDDYGGESGRKHARAA